MLVRLMAGLWLAALAGAQNATETYKPSETYKQGHSHFGEPFDSGPRTRPVAIAGIGTAHFPISTRNPEVQKWFDQGNALLHSFWYYEAERSFRWCLKLEPENPMAYWGLAMAAFGDRAKEFTREAVKRKHTATERERLYIEALEARFLSELPREKREDGYRRAMESLCVKYPQDLEARSYLALASMGENRYGAELMIREVLAKQPDHPGAHHYRIHNWDYHEPEQALVSSKRYGEIVPGIGHALHMPGHIYSIVGMWHEAAISMDSATRAELAYMKTQLQFPFNTWNYAHNRHYLSYIQEQLGMPRTALAGARQLLETPEDPQSATARMYGKASMLRGLLRFERWSDLFLERNLPWDDKFADKAWKAYAEARGHLELGNRDKAQKAFEAHAALKKDLDKNKNFEQAYQVQAAELRARLALARGETLAGLKLLTEAAEKEWEMQKEYADPPVYPESLYVALGDAYQQAKSPGLAVAAYRKALDLVKNDWFALTGLIEAHLALGERKEAEDAYGRLLYVTSGAEPGIARLERVKALGLKATPRDASPGTQRIYKEVSLERFGPVDWAPYEAPKFAGLDSEGKPVSLADFKGKNVMLVYYLGRECVHCMQQLQNLRKRAGEWKELDTVLVAVSPNSVETNRAAQKDMAGVTLVSDPERANARRFQAYDDFEEIELHATLLLDRNGRVYWGRIGGDPFSDFDFLAKTLKRMNALAGSASGGE